MTLDRKKGEGTLMLQPGEVIRADVLRDLRDGRWVLGLLGVEIAFPSLIPLMVGSTISLKVESSAEGKAFLRLVGAESLFLQGGNGTRERPSSKSRVDYRV
jgi:hypothetical protein